jgi:transcriptional regulator of met regulon
MHLRKLRITLSDYYKMRHDKLLPPETNKKHAVNISLEFIKLLAEKRKARAKWQRRHALQTKRLTADSAAR